MNKYLHPDTYEANLKTVDKPLAKFAGEVAWEQLQDELDYVNEQPVGSTMYTTVHPWPRVCSHPRHYRVSFDQCQLGQRNSRGQPVRKPTELRASEPDLIHYFQNLTCGRFPRLCQGHHEHLTGYEAYRARIWPWAFARRLSWGIVRLMRRKHWRPQHPGHYPTLPDSQVTCISCT